MYSMALLGSFRAIYIPWRSHFKITFTELYGIGSFSQLYMCVTLLTLCKAVVSALQNFTYLVTSCKFAISSCDIACML